MSSDDKECPYCAETIKAAAKKCKHCGEMLDIDTGEASKTAAVMPVAPDPAFEPAFGMFFPVLLVLVGMSLFIYGSTMDVTVPVDAEIIGISRVANIHLISQQRNYQISGGFLTLLGLILGYFVRQSQLRVTPRATVSEDTNSKSSGDKLPLLLFLVVAVTLAAGSASSSSPTPQSRPVSSSADLERKEKTEKVNRALDQIVAEAKAEKEKERKKEEAYKATEAKKMALRNQCFHRDKAGNRICTAPQKGGLYCAKHASAHSLTAKTTQPAAEEATESYSASYDYGGYSDYSYDYDLDYAETKYVPASIETESKYPTGDGSSARSRYDRCFYTAPNGKGCSMTSTSGLYCKYHQR